MVLQSNSEDVDMLGLEEVSQSSNSRDELPPGFALPQVLISVAIEGEQMLHTPDWLDWLKNLPAVAKSVRIQGVYKSDSTLLQLSLPVAVWDVMPDDPAVWFIAFVRTTNLVGQGVDRRQGHRTKRLRRSYYEASHRETAGLRAVRKASYTQQEPDVHSETIDLIYRPRTQFLQEEQSESSELSCSRPPASFTQREPLRNWTIQDQLNYGLPMYYQILIPSQDMRLIFDYTVPRSRQLWNSLSMYSRARQGLEAGTNELLETPSLSEGPSTPDIPYSAVSPEYDEHEEPEVKEMDPSMEDDRSSGEE